MDIDNTSTVAEPTQAKSSSPGFIGLIGSFILLIFKTFWAAITMFVMFFWELTFGKKLVFIIILAVLILITLLLGRSTGYADGYSKANQEVQTSTGFEIKDLNIVMDEIDSLRETLERARNR